MRELDYSELEMISGGTDWWKAAGQIITSAIASTGATAIIMVIPAVAAAPAVVAAAAVAGVVCVVAGATAVAYGAYYDYQVNKIVNMTDAEFREYMGEPKMSGVPPQSLWG